MIPTEYQKKVVDEIRDRKLKRALLQWPVGVGKTLASILIANMWNDNVRLVVCPKSLVPMWNEVLKSESDLPVTDLTSDKYAKELPLPLKGWYVINYDLLIRRPWLMYFEGCTAILDESSFIKHYDSARTRRVIAMDNENVFRHLCMLSGTPCGNRYEHMWSHAYLLGRRMKYINYMHHFVNEIVNKKQDGTIYRTISKSNPYKNIDSLNEDLDDKGRFTLDPKDCLSLPGKTDITISVPAPPEYKQFLNQMVTTVSSLEKTVEPSGRIVMKPKPLVLRGENIPAVRQGLRRVASSYNSHKFEAVRDILKSTDERVVIFYQFKEDCNKLMELCREEDKPVAVMNGEMHDLSKTGNNYEKHDNSVTLIQWQSGGYGLNLQKARIGVFFSLPDSYELYAQARGRILRKGQTLPVVYYNIEAKGTIDANIWRALDRQEDYGNAAFLSDFRQFSGMGMDAKGNDEFFEIIDMPKHEEQQPSLFDNMPEGYHEVGKDPQLWLFEEEKKNDPPPKRRTISKYFSR